jgi:hypothetical protein
MSPPPFGLLPTALGQTPWTGPSAFGARLQLAFFPQTQLLSRHVQFKSELKSLQADVSVQTPPLHVSRRPEPSDKRR